MNINGITSAITKNADLLGGILGFTTGSTHGLADIESSIENLLAGQVHIPDVKNMIRSYLDQPYFKNGLMLYGVGWLATELKIPFLSKYGKAIQNFGSAYAIGSFLNMLIWSMTHADQGCNPADEDMSRMYERVITKANMGIKGDPYLQVLVSH